MKALVVDDSRFVRLWMVRALARLGWECSEAEHGGVALDRLRADGFDLMLVDVNMPVLSGVGCLRALQRSEAPRGKAMKIMMVTTEADTSFMQAALELGADEFLMKPVTEEGLQSKLLLLGLEGGR